LCQITSQTRTDEYSVSLNSADFVSVGLTQGSWIRPNRLFTAGSGIVVYRAGQLLGGKLDETVERLTGILLPS